MGSPTKKTENRRRTRKKNAGTKGKKARARAGTPAFAVHGGGAPKPAASAKNAKSA